MAPPQHRLSRILAWRAEAIGFELFSWLLRRLPSDLVSDLGGWLGRTIGPLTSAHRIALRNLELALPELPLDERRRIALEHWASFGRYIFEFPIAERLTPAKGRMEVVEPERMAAILASGRPAVFISGHFANPDLMAAAILDAGIVCDITYRAPNNPFVDKSFAASRWRYGVRLFAPKGRQGARELIEGLKAGRSIAMMNDQRYDGGAEGLFFGHPVRTNPAAARLAQRFGTFIQPLSLQRTRGARFRLVAHEPIHVAALEDPAAAVTATVQAINDFIEARVRERPEEWWWMHKRFPPEVYSRS